jgi:hypothetical protein
MAAHLSNRPEPVVEKSQLSKQDTRLLLVMCTELVNLCAKLTGKIDPAAAAMLAYVRDDIVAENKDELHLARVLDLISGKGRAPVRRSR